MYYNLRNGLKFQVISILCGVTQPLLCAVHYTVIHSYFFFLSLKSTICDTDAHAKQLNPLNGLQNTPQKYVVTLGCYNLDISWIVCFLSKGCGWHITSYEKCIQGELLTSSKSCSLKPWANVGMFDKHENTDLIIISI